MARKGKAIILDEPSILPLGEGCPSETSAVVLGTNTRIGLGLESIHSSLRLEDLDLLRIAYYIPLEFKLQLPRLKD